MFERDLRVKEKTGEGALVEGKGESTQVQQREREREREREGGGGKKRWR